MADAASWAGVDASLRADMGVAERGGSDAARATGYICQPPELYPLTVTSICLCLLPHAGGPAEEAHRQIPSSIAARTRRLSCGHRLSGCTLRRSSLLLTMSLPPSPQPPVPFADFEYAFDPALSSLFPPSSALLPPSADLFSPSETTDLLGFLDNFNWDFDSDPAFGDITHPPHPPTMSPPLPQTILRPLACTSPSSGTSTQPEVPRDNDEDLVLPPTPPGGTSRARPARRKSVSAPRQTARTKPLLSTPQKRLNHIMSEQKRRNAIRDGYAQLIALIAPAGTIDLPSRGRPKGSGTRSNGQTKGKSGVLFRAVEYCKWLEEGRDALREEVLRLEAAAGIGTSC